MAAISEKLDTPVIGSYDVVVLGGGMAGIGAAVAARRNHASVLMVEKTIFPGGLATTGLITYYEPLCDGKGRTIITGLAEEFLHLTYRYGWDNLEPVWKSPGPHPEAGGRYEARYNAQALILGLDEVLESEGVTVWYDTAFCRPVMNGNTVQYVVLENKSGRGAVEAGVVIDATGDADCLVRAGVPCLDGENWLVLVSKMITLEGMSEAVAAGDVNKAIKGQMLGGSRLGKGVAPDKPKYTSIEAADVNDFAIAGRRLLREKVRDQEHSHSAIVTLPSMAQLRTTRRLDGGYTLKEADVDRGFEDSIGTICDFSQAGPVYEIPFRTLVHSEFPNLITCGRTISSEGHAWEVTRVIPPAVLTGEAAGTAAAMAGRGGWGSVPVADLQSRLEKQGIQIHTPVSVRS